EHGRIFVIHDRRMGGVAHSHRLLPIEAQFLPRIDPAYSVAGFGRQSTSGHPMIASNLRSPPVELTRVWAIPYWPLIVVTLLPPLLWFMRWRRHAGRAAGHQCVVCGYDLRATPDRCPECGTEAIRAPT